MVTHISPSVSDAKRPYGGLVPPAPKGQRPIFDAAAYNHQLAQHQAYTAQVASQAANVTRNPYIVAHPPQQPSGQAASSSYQNSPDVNVVPYQPQQHHTHSHTQYAGQNTNRGLSHQNSAGQLASNAGPTPGSATGPYAPPTHSGGGGVNQPHLNPPSGSGGGPGSATYYPNSRARANTINQMDAVPPALARLQHMNQDLIGGRNALTPVLNRDDAMKEWERRQQGGKPAQVQPYPQLEYLQQQAEMAAAGGLSGWGANVAAAAALGMHPHAHNHRYPPPPSKLSQSYHPQNLLVDDESSRRDAIISNVRTVARGDNGPPNQQGQQQQSALSTVPISGTQQVPPPPPQSGGLYGSGGGGAAFSVLSPNTISSPPQAYGSNMAVTGNRYAATYGGPQPPPPQSQQHQVNGGVSAGGGAAVASFESIDRRGDMGNMYVPMQPDNYHQQQHQHQYAGPGNPAPQAAPRHMVAPPQQAVPTSFYGAGVVPTGVTQSHSQQGQQGQVQQNQQGPQQQRNPFTSMPIPDNGVGMGGIGKPDVRRGNGMDPWPR